MRKQIAQQTILMLLAWLVYQNFNTAATPEPLTNNRPVCCAGKGMESGCSLSADHGIMRAGALALPAGYQIKKVVLDAGHGGKDPGCSGAFSKEKDNALGIVLKLGALIEAEYPDVEVIYTRKTDIFVELNERAAIANRNNADLFISVHCNSISVSNVKGAETYVMGLHTAGHNLEVAKRENASIFLEDNYQKNYAGYDPNSPEAHILGSVWQSAYLEQSILFAGFVQQYAKELADRQDRGVKQAGFIVLKETAMPSVLIEAGFLTNRAEEQFIASEDGQAHMANAILEAFRSYKAQMEGTPLQPRRANKVLLAAKGGTASPASANKPAAASPTSTPPPALAVKTAPATPSAGFPVSAPPRPASEVYADEVLMPTVSAKGSPGGYRIYLLSWKNRLDKNAGQLSLIGDVEEEQANGEFHYYTGKFASKAEADKMLPEIINLGFRMARIIPVKK